MNDKVMLVDVSKCTACRACQVACKQWNQLPAEATKQLGTYQNPPDLTWATWNLIRFQEVATQGGGMRWFFRRDSCFHCTDAACQKACPVPGCISKADYGAVVINQDLCIGCKACVSACPFEIPRIDARTNRAFKCHLCSDRVPNGLIPACAKACPTGTITFGTAESMVAKAYARAKILGGDAMVYGDQYVKGTHVVYVLPEKVRMYSRLPVNPSVPLATILWKDVLKPLSALAILGALAGTFFHYVIKGPKRPEEGGE